MRLLTIPDSVEKKDVAWISFLSCLRFEFWLRCCQSCYAAVVVGTGKRGGARADLHDFVVAVCTGDDRVRDGVAVGAIEQDAGVAGDGHLVRSAT